MNAEARRWNETTEKIIGCAFAVGNPLGCGFLEKVYEKAPAHELRKKGLKVEQQRRIVMTSDIWVHLRVSAVPGC